MDSIEILMLNKLAYAADRQFMTIHYFV